MSRAAKIALGAPALLAILVAAGCRSDNGAQDEQAPAATPPALADLAAGDPRLPGLEPADESVDRALRAWAAEAHRDSPARTRHLDEAGRPLYINRLARETSPYLLQHAWNPVNWYPWSQAAFERARREDKPVLLSIGYSTCHWCHVMEHESFEDPEIAAFINRHFVPVKVDREERPDLDDVYMAAVQLLTGRGGWPMTVVLDHERRPFFAGTYFPARDGDRGASKGFLTILGELRDSWSGDRDALVRRASELSERIRRAATPQPAGEVPSPAAIAAIADRFRASFDPEWGGFGRAPKFPRPVELGFLLRAARRLGDPGLAAMATRTLERIARGGIHDHVGGGFHRYATDRRWLVPHFEKMLYDQALLAVACTEAWQVTGNPLFAATVGDILDYVTREMTTPEGAFYSATDADSPAADGHMEEGLFFTWTPEEVREAAAEDADILLDWYGIDEGGNFEGRSIATTWKETAEVARRHGLGEEELARRIERGRRALYEVRSRRPPPLRDDKVIVSWNGLMLGAFARAGLVFSEDRWVSVARRAAEFLLAATVGEDGRLARTWKGGRARHEGVLDDYAALVGGLLDLFEATGERRWLAEAARLQDTQDAHFLDREQGGYFTTAADAERLIVRDKPDYDGAEPSGNSLAALNLLRLEEFTQDPARRERAEGVLAAVGAGLERGWSGAPALASALDFYADSPEEIVVVRARADGDDAALVDEVRRRFLPSRVLIRHQAAAHPAEADPLLPLVAGKTAREGLATGYVCEKGHCEFPTTDPAVFGEQLDRLSTVVPPAAAGQ